MTSDYHMRSAVLSIGRIYCDLIFTGLETMPVLGREIFADDLRIAAGGGAFIMAAYSVHIGRKTALLSRLGIDGLSKGLTAELETSGVDLRFLDRATDAGPQVTVAINNGEERAFLSRRAGGAEPATLGEALAWSEARHLHIAEFATLAEIPGLVGKARENGLTVSLDPSWDETLIYQRDFLNRCAGVDLFLPLPVAIGEDRALGADHVAQRPQDAVCTADHRSDPPQGRMHHHGIPGGEADVAEILGDTAPRRGRCRQLAAPA